MKKTLLLINIILIASCSSVPEMNVNKFGGFTSIDKGESAELTWDFANAYYVEIEGFPQKFKDKDTIVVSPEKTTLYKFSAIQNEDTIRKTWRVIVVVPEEEQKISKFDYNTSYTESKYFKGVMDNAKMIVPKRLKITSTKILNEKNEIKFKGILLDEFGNYIPGLVRDNKLKWHISQKCNEKTANITLDQYKEIINEDKLNISFLIDKSAAADYLTRVNSTVKDFIENSKKNDKFSLFTFDHNFDKAFENQYPNKIKDASIKVEKTMGLNAIYKNAFIALNEQKQYEGKQAFIILNFSSNNAATIYNISDVIKEANSYNIPIYLISIGDAVDTFSSKYLAYGSGGSFYDLGVDDLSLLKDILNEIYFSLNSHYEFKVPLSKLNHCKFDVTQISAEFNDEKISDDIYLVKEAEWLGSKSQSIALFDYKKTILEDDFDDLITSMARVLNDNESYSLELIGHSSVEGSEDTNLEISLGRAEAVKNRFLNLGVNKNQLKIRAEGSSMPIYFMPNASWQQYYNRRVEIRWLIPEMLPYEIIAEESWTEEEALNRVSQWRSRGYRSYYERFLVENMPKYKIKLWGYSEESEAKDAVQEIISKFGVKARME